MSKTYKTDPSWVKVVKYKTSPAVKERHDHSNGVCDFDKIDPKTPFWWQQRWKQSNCGYDVSYYGYHGGFYARRSNTRSWRREAQRSMRAGWRKAKHDLLKLDKDGVYDYDVKSYQHRHSALWEMY